MWKKKEAALKESMLRNMPNVDVVIDLQKTIMRLTEQVAIARSETEESKIENEWLHKQLKMTRADNETYLDCTTKRVEDKIAEVNELVRKMEEEESEAEKLRLVTLAELQVERRKLTHAFRKEKNNAFFERRFLDMDNYSCWKMSNERDNTIQLLLAEVEKFKEKNAKETYELRNKFLRDRREINGCHHRDLMVVHDNIKKYLRPNLLKRLDNLQDVNTQAQDLLQTTLQKKKALQANRDKLVKAKAAMQKDRDYWVDMNSMNEPSRNHKTAEAPRRVSAEEAARPSPVVAEQKSSKKVPTPAEEQWAQELIRRPSYSETVLTTTFSERRMSGPRVNESQLESKRRASRRNIDGHLGTIND